MSALEIPSEMTQADFARLHSVTKKTVTTWKHQGYVALTASGRVDVALSNSRLQGRPDVNRGGVTRHARAGKPALETLGNRALRDRLRQVRMRAFAPRDPDSAA